MATAGFFQFLVDTGSNVRERSFVVERYDDLLFRNGERQSFDATYEIFEKEIAVCSLADSSICIAIW